MQNNSVNKGIFQFLGARIWVPMSVYQYENSSGYNTDLFYKFCLYFIDTISTSHAINIFDTRFSSFLYIETCFNIFVLSSPQQCRSL